MLVWDDARSGYVKVSVLLSDLKIIYIHVGVYDDRLATIHLLNSTRDIVRTRNESIDGERRSRVPDSNFVKGPSCNDASQAPEQVRFSQVLKLQVPRISYWRIAI